MRHRRQGPRRSDSPRGGGVARPDVRGTRPPRPGRSGHGAARARRARASPVERPRPVVGGAPADGERRPAAVDRLQRRDLQLPGTARGVGARGTSLPLPLGHRGAAAPLRDRGPGLPAAAARHVRVRGLGRARARAGAGARPARGEAALLPRRPRGADLRVRAQGGAPGPRGRAGDRTGRARPVPHLPVRARAALRVPRRAQAPAGPLAPLPGRTGRDPTLLAAPLPAQAACRDRRRAPGRRARAAAAARGGGPAQARERRPGGGVPERRDRLRRGGGHDEPLARPTGADVLDRLRRRALRRIGDRAPRGRAVRRAAHRVQRPARRRGPPARAGPSLRRAVRGRFGHPDLHPGRARAPAGHGGAERGWRGRVLRGL